MLGGECQVWYYASWGWPYFASQWPSWMSYNSSTHSGTHSSTHSSTCSSTCSSAHSNTHSSTHSSSTHTIKKLLQAPVQLLLSQLVVGSSSSSARGAQVLVHAVTCMAHHDNTTPPWHIMTTHTHTEKHTETCTIAHTHAHRCIQMHTSAPNDMIAVRCNKHASKD